MNARPQKSVCNYQGSKTQVGKQIEVVGPMDQLIQPLRKNEVVVGIIVKNSQTCWLFFAHNMLILRRMGARMNDVMVCNLADHSVLLFPQVHSLGSKASSKNQPIIIFYRVSAAPASVTVQKKCRKELHANLRQLACMRSKARPGDWSIFKMDP